MEKRKKLRIIESRHVVTSRNGLEERNVKEKQESNESRHRVSGASRRTSTWVSGRRKLTTRAKEKNMWEEGGYSQRTSSVATFELWWTRLDRSTFHDECGGCEESSEYDPSEFTVVSAGAKDTLSVI